MSPLAALGWKRGDTVLYQQSYGLTEDEQKDFPGSKSIKPDFVLVDLQRMPLDEMRIKIEQSRRRQREQEVDVTKYKDIAGGFDPAAGKDRYYQLDCIRLMLTFRYLGRREILAKEVRACGLDVVPKEPPPCPPPIGLTRMSF